MKPVIKTELHGKNLILFPCNPGAEVGNYFTARTWAQASKNFPERATDIDFAAVDCIRTGIDGRALVFEDEMNVVLGNNEYPEYTHSRLLKVCEGLEKDKERVASYDNVIIYLNVPVYDHACKKVLSALPNVRFFYWENKKPAFFIANLPVLRKVVDFVFYEKYGTPILNGPLTNRFVELDYSDNVKNKIRRPGKGMCRDVWDTADVLTLQGRAPALETIVEQLLSKQANITNTRHEYYQWKKFHGIEWPLFTVEEEIGIRFQNSMQISLAELD